MPYGEFFFVLRTYSNGLIADIIEDMYSPRTAAINFVTELVRKRGKENLQKFLAFIVEVFRR